MSMFLNLMRCCKPSPRRCCHCHEPFGLYTYWKHGYKFCSREHLAAFFKEQAERHRQKTWYGYLARGSPKTTGL